MPVTEPGGIGGVGGVGDGTYVALADAQLAVPELQTDLDGLSTLQAAERDIDSLLGQRPPYPDTGLKLRPASLKAWEAAALSRATIEQVRWRYATAGKRTGATPTVVTARKGPEFEESYATAPDAFSAPERVGQLAVEELTALSHLVQRTARSTR